VLPVQALLREVPLRAAPRMELDFPRLMMRVHAQRHRAGTPVKEKLTDQFRPDRPAGEGVGARVTGREQADRVTRSLSRRAMEKTVGMAAQRVLPPTPASGSRRGSSGTSRRAARRQRGGCVPDVLHRVHEPAIGRDLVGVYERNGISCSVPQGPSACGAPWLHQGNVAEFEKSARQNVAALAEEVRAGKDVIVAQPTCAYVLKRDYPLYVGVPTPSWWPSTPSTRPSTCCATTGARNIRSTSTSPGARACPTRSRTTCPATPGTEHRPEEPRPAEAGRREV